MKFLPRRFVAPGRATPASPGARVAVMLMFAVLFVVSGVSGYRVGAAAATAQKNAAESSR
jgi:hypothetical protein